MSGENFSTCPSRSATYLSTHSVRSMSLKITSGATCIVPPSAPAVRLHPVLQAAPRRESATASRRARSRDRARVLAALGELHAQCLRRVDAQRLAVAQAY